MSEYAFASNDRNDELARLRLLERALDGHTVSILTKAGIVRGMRCLEVGAGAGSILEWMAGVVGSTGRVVGVDRHAGYLRHLGGPTIGVLEGDLMEVGLHESFDLIHARYVLIHNEDGLAMLSRLSGLLDPGGMLVVEEADFTTSKWIDARYRARGNRVNRAGCELFKSMGLNPAYGAEVLVDIERAGLEIVGIFPRMHLDRGRSPMAEMMGASVDTLRARYVATGFCSESDIDGYLDGTRDERSMQIYYTTISVIARKSG